MVTKKPKYSQVNRPLLLTSLLSTHITPRVYNFYGCDFNDNKIFNMNN